MQAVPILQNVPQSKDHVKTVMRHIWEPYMEMCEEIRQTLGMKELYSQRKETIERIFGSAKENHGFRYTQMFGKARMEMKVGLTFACMNLKKLARIKAKWGEAHFHKLYFERNLVNKKKTGFWDTKPKTSPVYSLNRASYEALFCIFSVLHLLCFYTLFLS